MDKECKEKEIQRNVTGAIEKFGIVTCSKDEFLITGFTLVGYASIQDAGLAVLQWVADKIQDKIEYIDSVGIHSAELLGGGVSICASLNEYKRGNNG